MMSKENEILIDFNTMFDRTYYRVFQKKTKTRGIRWNVSEVSLWYICELKRLGYKDNYFFVTYEEALKKCNELKEKGNEN